MAAPRLTAAITAIESAAQNTPQTTRAQAYIDLLPSIPIPEDETTTSSEEETTTSSFHALYDSALNSLPALSLMSLRPFLEAYISRLLSVPSPTIRITVGTHALDTLSSRASGTFEEVDASLRSLLADAHESREEYILSAQQLSAINLDSSLRKVTDDFKFGILVRIIRCYIEEDETIQASAFLSRAKNLIYKIQDPILKLQFALSEARILDALRDFLPAADRYLSVSLSPALDTEERLLALSSSITCAVLAPAGPPRSKTLSRLYRDERALSLPTSVFSILEKMHLDRPLDHSDITAFKAIVKPHHLALTSENVTVLDKAVIEHNLLATSKIYEDISVEALGVILGVDTDKAEDYAERMIQQERLRASIDQIEGVIYFENAEAEDGDGGRGKVGKGGVGEGKEVLRVWERNVRGVVEEVERVMGLVGGEFPVWVEREMGTMVR
jgi:COP9 signalosome complex subunit 4